MTPRHRRRLFANSAILLVLGVLLLGCGSASAPPLDTATAQNTVSMPAAKSSTPEPSPTAKPLTVAASTAALPTAIADICGEGESPEAAISRCSAYQPYRGDCELGKGREDSACSTWIDGTDDLRLYSVAAPPDTIVNVLAQRVGAAWKIAGARCMTKASNAIPDVLCKPPPFKNRQAQYYLPHAKDRNDRTAFGIAQADVLADRATIRLMLYFKNVGASPVVWTSDVGASGVYLRDTEGVSYPSVAVGGHFAEDLTPLEPGKQRSGWHDFHVGLYSRVFMLYYPGHQPLPVDLTGTPSIDAVR